ncbi:MAG: hypothetical protein ACK5LQ_02065 [Planctomycetota bacterium]|jgi:hypothetical protein
MPTRACGTVSFSGLKLFLIVLLSLIQSMEPIQGGVIAFSSDFESGLSPLITGSATIVSVEGLQGKGNSGNTFSGSLMVNKQRGLPAASCTLTLSNLPTHSSIQIGFLLAIINSWDGSSEDDRFEVLLDGQTVFTETFDNFFVNDQTYVPPANVQIVDRVNVPQFNQQIFPNLGFGGFNGGNNDWGDAGYDMFFEPRLQSIAHSGSTATIVWRGTYSGMSLPEDEFWGIDNLKVTLYGTSAVPEPSSAIAFSGLGLLSLRLANRRLRMLRKS